jgi:protein associated with RNAse G/E
MHRSYRIDPHMCAPIKLLVSPSRMSKLINFATFFITNIMFQKPKSVQFRVDCSSEFDTICQLIRYIAFTADVEVNTAVNEVLWDRNSVHCAKSLQYQPQLLHSILEKHASLCIPKNDLTIAVRKENFI